MYSEYAVDSRESVKRASELFFFFLCFVWRRPHGYSNAAAEADAILSARMRRVHSEHVMCTFCALSSVHFVNWLNVQVNSNKPSS